MNNYWDNIDFTKIEFLIFLFPLLYIPVLLDSHLFFFINLEKPDILAYPSDFNIYYATAVSAGVFILIAYLSHKGYTSYTPWLEHLANKKLEIDKKIFELIKDENVEDIKNLRAFYETDKENKDQLEKDKAKNNEELRDYFFGRKPEDEEKVWYEVFTESFDYTMYDILFQIIYPNWIDQNYERNENIIKPGKERDVPPEKAFSALLNNPELIPTKKDFKNYEDETDAENNGLMEINYYDRIKEEFDKGNDEILNAFSRIFKNFDDNKLLIYELLAKKAEIDIEYYAIMVNFRNGLLKVTEKWLEVKKEADDAERGDTKKATDYRNVGGLNLQKDFDYQIENLEKDMKRLFDSFSGSTKKTSTKTKEDLDEVLDEREEDSVENQIEAIEKQLVNRNEWESHQWRAMGVIYYRWRDDIRKIRDAARLKSVDEVVKESRDLKFEDKDHRKIDYQPLDEIKQNITVRAVNDLTEWFGTADSGKGGKVILFFGVVFGLIAAVALTNSIDTLIATLFDEDSGQFVYENFTDNIYMFFLFLGFFPLAILYYHGGTVFLSADASGKITDGKNALVLVNFFIILTMAIILYFLAASIADVEFFLWLVIALAGINIVWTMIFTGLDMRDKVRDAPIFIEWIAFELIIIIFAGIFMGNYDHNPVETMAYTQDVLIFGLLFGILIMRLGIDYRYAWSNFWSHFGDAE